MHHLGVLLERLAGLGVRTVVVVAVMEEVLLKGEVQAQAVTMAVEMVVEVEVKVVQAQAQEGLGVRVVNRAAVEAVVVAAITRVV